jgi:hypothetical protein
MIKKEVPVFIILIIFASYVNAVGCDLYYDDDPIGDKMSDDGCAQELLSQDPPNQEAVDYALEHPEHLKDVNDDTLKDLARSGKLNTNHYNHLDNQQISDIAKWSKSDLGKLDLSNNNIWQRFNDALSLADKKGMWENLEKTQRHDVAINFLKDLIGQMDAIDFDGVPEDKMQTAMQANNYEVKTLTVEDGQVITSKKGKLYTQDGTVLPQGAKDIEVYDGYTIIDGKKYVNRNLVVKLE